MLIAAVKYSPVGNRGIGVLRASGYVAYSGEASQYVEFANEQTMVILQFEESDVLQNFEAMISRPWVDAVVIGPRDLMLKIGFADGVHYHEVQAKIDEAIAICKQVGIAVGITATTKAEVEKQIARGATMILGVVQTLVLNGAKDFLGK